MKFDQNNSHCSLFTKKEGAFSAVAHDLEIKVSRFSIDVDGSKLSAVFHADSLRVIGPVTGGVTDASGLSDKDKKKIESNIVKDVLKPNKYPTVEFSADDVSQDTDAFKAAGTLTLCGKNQSFAAKLSPEDNNWVLNTTIRQSDFGIKPFSAMLGQLRIQDEVGIRLTLPRELT